MATTLALVATDWLSGGVNVEVEQTEPSLRDSRYEAVVITPSAECSDGTFEVEYMAFSEDDDGEKKLREWIPRARLRPSPPPKAPDEWLAAASKGYPMEVLFEDGWWYVSFEQAVADATELVEVFSESFGTTQHVELVPAPTLTFHESRREWQPRSGRHVFCPYAWRGAGARCRGAGSRCTPRGGERDGTDADQPISKRCQGQERQEAQAPFRDAEAGVDGVRWARVLGRSVCGR